MSKNKISKLFLFPLALMGIIPFVSANVNGPNGFSFSNIGGFLANILNQISCIFEFGWLRGHEIGFMKFLLWIMVFAIFFAAGHLVFSRLYGNAVGPARRNAMIIALIIATTTVLLTPGGLVATIFAAYASVVIFLMIIVPIAIIVYLVYFGPLSANLTGPALHLVRVIALLLCWIIVAAISENADLLTGTTTFAAPLLISIGSLNAAKIRR